MIGRRYRRRAVSVAAQQDMQQGMSGHREPM